jgi:hypothetical protein
MWRRTAARLIASAWRVDIATGFLLVFALLAYLAHVFVGAPVWPALAASWSAAVWGWPGVDPPMRRLATTLLLAGTALLAAVWLAGNEPGFESALGINMPVVALFVGISFLSLVGQALDTGQRPHEVVAAASNGAGTASSVWRTMAHVNLIGGVINLSMVTIVGDRIRRGPALDRAQTIALVRSYCAAAFWSPFFVAAAVAATYAPGSNPVVTVPLGASAALVALWVTARDVRALGAGTFAGYRPDRMALLMSIGLVLAVLSIGSLAPALSVVVIVAAVSPPFALALMPRTDRGARLRGLLTQTLPATSPQVILFLAAGVFAHGAALALTSFIDLAALHAVVLPVAGYSAVIALIVLGAYVGLHPIVTIAALAALVAPMSAEPSLLAFAFLAGWAIATAAAPLSGVNLLIVGRYRVAARDIVLWHPRYAATMWLVSTALIAVAHWILPG